MNSAKYQELSKKYLKEAKDFLASEDYVQASEKYWEAVAELVKAIAEERGLKHYRHHELRGTVSKLVAETGDVEIGRLFSVAEALHTNFYENFASPIEVYAYVEDMKELIGKLERIKIK